jgi:hypothetical protein
MDEKTRVRKERIPPRRVGKRVPSPLGAGAMLTKYKLVMAETDPRMQELANEHQCVYLAMVAPTLASAAGIEITDTPLISDDEVIEFDYVVASIKERTKKPLDLFLVLETPGGLPAAAFKIARLLRSSFNKITVLVPFTSYSAGTLIALIGDEIVMGPVSNLGPLDVQVPGNEGVYVSGSAFRKAFEWMEQIQKEQKCDTSLDAMLKWIDPIMLRSFEDLQKASELYLRQILTESHYGPTEVQAVVSALVWDLPTHEFAIMRERAKELGIRVRYSEDFPDWSIIKDWVLRLMFVGKNDHVLSYVLWDEIGRLT